MSKAALTSVLKLFDAQQRRDVVYADTFREATPDVVRHTSRVGGRGFILYWNIKDADVERVAREQIDHFARAGNGFEWKIYGHDLPPGLGGQLQRLGFSAEPEETVVCLDLAEMPERLLVLRNDRVERVTEPDAVDEIAAHNAVWHNSREDIADSLKLQLREDSNHFGLYVVRAEGKVTSIGWVRFDEHSSFASLWGGATAPKWRHHGFYSALVAARAHEAVRRGYRYLTVDALPTSRPILEKLGFQALTTVRGYVWSVPSQDRARDRECLE